MEHPSPATAPSLYRKWRSRGFFEVVGQAHVTQTLRNAVRSGTFGHAYLFAGPRGTGKTSTARIVARAVNCLNLQDGEPCNRCAPCQAMLANRCLDLVEIDAASARALRPGDDGRAQGAGHHRLALPAPGLPHHLTARHRGTAGLRL